MTSASSSQVPVVGQGSTTGGASGVASTEQMTRIIEKDSLGEISSTKSLIEAFNSVVEDGDISKGIEWIHKCIKWFATLPADCVKAKEVQEYAHLGLLKTKTLEAKEVISRWFTSFCNKLSDTTFGQPGFLMAFIYILEIIDRDAFNKDPTFLFQLAHVLFEELKFGEYTRGTFQTKWIIMQAIHQCFVVIQEVCPSKLNAKKDDGLIKLFSEQLDDIIKNQSYYPFSYQAEMLKSDLDSLEDDGNLSTCYCICRRVFQGVYGSLCFAHFIRKLITLEFDHSALEKGIEMLKLSTKRTSIRSKEWQEWIIELKNFAISILEDPTQFGKLENAFDELCTKSKGFKSKQERVALKYGMLDILVLMVRGGSERVQILAINKLMKIGEECFDTKTWQEDLDLYEGVLDALSSIYHKSKEQEKVRASLNRLLELDGDNFKKRGIEWLEKHTLDDKLKEECNNSNVKASDTVFNIFLEQEQIAKISTMSQVTTTKKVKKEIQDKLEIMHKDLKKKYLYREFGEVPSLFYDEPTMHVEDFNFHMKYDFEYEKGEVEKVSILLDELFDKRLINRKEVAIDINKLLLVGNPGTGKTSITKRIAYDWANGKWGKEFEAIYVVPVRELMASHYNGYNMRRRKALSCAIVTIYFGLQEDDMFKEFDELIEKDIKKSSTLLILDGLDEKAGACQQILQEALNVSCKLFMSSRPYNLQVQRNIADLEVDCMGLNEIQVKKFIKLQLNEEKTQSLLNVLQERETLKQVVHVPVTLNMLCVLWKREKEEKVKRILRGNLMVLYKMLVSFLWNRFIEKGFVDGPKQASKKEVIIILTQIAFKKLEKGEILFGEDMIDDLCDDEFIKEMLKHVGFILLQEVKKAYHFPHLTFQEYFAGIYLSHNLLGENEEEKDLIEDFFLSKKYNMQFNVTFDFAYEEIGFLAKKQGLKKLLELVNEEPKEVLGIQNVLLMLQIFDKISGIDDYFDRLKRKIPQEVKDASTFIEKVLAFLLNSKTYREELKYMLKTLGTMPNTIRLNSSIVDPLIKAYLNSNRIGDTKAFGQVIKHVPSKMDLFVKTVISKRGERDFGVIVEMIEVSPWHGESLVEFVFDKCKNANESIRSYAYSQLGRMSAQVPKKTKDIINVLLKECSDDNKNVRAVLYAQLGATINEASEHMDREVLHILVKCRDQDEDIRRNAYDKLREMLVMALSQRDMIMRQLLEGVEDNSLEVREVSYKQFGKILEFASDQREDILTQLYVGCKDEDRNVRSASYGQLGEAMELMEEKREEIFKEIYVGFKNKSFMVRIESYGQAGKAMELMKEKREKILEQLCIGCEDGHDYVREASYKHLGKAMELIKEKREEILTQFYIGCKDRDWNVRQATYEQLGKTMELTEEKREKILTQLFKGCKDEIIDVRNTAKYYYDKAMEKDQGEEGKIEKTYPIASRDRSKGVGDKDKSSVEKKKEEEERTMLVVKQLCIGLGDVKEICDISYNQLKRLLKIDLDRRDEIVEKLLNECGNSNDEVHKVLYKLLGQALEIAPSQRKKIVEELLNSTSDETWQNRLVLYEQIGKALEFVEEEKERIMNKLFDGCEDMDNDVCEVVYNQLGKALEILEDERKKIVDQILVGCGSESWRVRRACYNHFGKAMEIVEERRGSLLRKLYVGSGDKDWRVRESSYNQFGKAMEMVEEERGGLVEQLYVGCGDENDYVRESSYNQIGKAIELVVEERGKLLRQLLKGCDDRIREVKIECYKQFSEAFKYIPQASEKLVEKLLEACLHWYGPIHNVVYKQLEIANKMHVEQREKIVDFFLVKCQRKSIHFKQTRYRDFEQGLYQDVVPDIYKGLGRMLELCDVRRDRIVDQILLGCKDRNDKVRNEAYKQLRKVLKKNLGEDESIFELLWKGLEDEILHVRRSVSKVCKVVLEEEKKYSKKLFHCIVDSCLEVDDVGYEIQRRVGSNNEFFDLLMGLDLDVLMKYSREEVDSRVVSLIIRQMIRRPVVFDQGSDGWKMVVYGVKNEEYNVSEEVVKSIRKGVDGFKRKLGV